MKNIKIRELMPEDLPLIKDTMFYGIFNSQIYRNKFYSPLLRHLVKKICETSQGLIACDKDDETCIYSYIIGHQSLTGNNEPFNVVHFVYTKQQFRKFGLATILINQFNNNNNRVLHTFRTQLKTKKYTLTYVPEYMAIGEINVRKENN